MKVIALVNNVLGYAITKEMCDIVSPCTVEDMRNLGYEDDCCYQVAAIHQFLACLNPSERKDVLDVLHLKPKADSEYVLVNLTDEDLEVIKENGLSDQVISHNGEYLVSTEVIDMLSNIADN